MEKTLGRKQNISNSQWIDVMENIEKYVTRTELEELVNKTVEEIKKITNGKKAAYAWSAGKDSIVLGKLCEMAGIEECMLAICDLEYPAFLEWINENKPEKLEIINTGQNLEWLEKHPDMLFPQDSKTAATWFRIVQHTAQAKYYKENQLDMILLGRRRADGNYVGKGTNIYTNAKGITRYSPIADWPHEAVLAFIHYYEMEMPPIYDWKNGYLCGTHPWPARQWTKDMHNAWDEVYQICPEIVQNASGRIPGAEEYIKSKTE